MVSLPVMGIGACLCGTQVDRRLGGKRRPFAPSRPMAGERRPWRRRRPMQRDRNCREKTPNGAPAGAITKSSNEAAPAPRPNPPCGESAGRSCPRARGAAWIKPQEGVLWKSTRNPTRPLAIPPTNCFAASRPPQSPARGTGAGCAVVEGMASAAARYGRSMRNPRPCFCRPASVISMRRRWRRFARRSASGRGNWRDRAQRRSIRQ